MFKFNMSRSQFELAKYNVPGFWPDPDTLNKIPKEPYEIQAELARINAAKAEKRRRLEQKAAELGITEEN
ncbi:hypothetical protein KL914_003750 [Ogataea haglerorum]|uniref:Uncharacterized protein n=1 Tax=Ogataea haglerorum TaxID=1937702 RepID=A0ABQ7RCV3_9ASCO|nr:hypothetical protein KL914_003750 [Ogataea haglerorum]KAG7763293.1 hypothetical protein KL946_004109 [Ogataea haglerorum]